MSNKAEKIIALYSEGFLGLTKPECLGADFSEAQCDELLNVLGTGIAGEITPEEKDQLKNVDFSDTFIRDLAGDDGLKALKTRAKWLGNHINKRWWRFSDFDDETRVVMIQEIQSMRGHTSMTLEALTEALDNANKKIRVEAALALANFGSQAAPAVPALVKALHQVGENKEDEEKTILALGEVGPAAVMAAPILINKLNSQGSLVMDRKIVEMALAKIGGGDPQVLAYFANKIRNSDFLYPFELETTTLAFKNLGGEGMLTLVELLKSQDSRIRQKAATIVGGLNARLAAPAITVLEDMAQSDPNSTCQYAAKHALEELRGTLH